MLGSKLANSSILGKSIISGDKVRLWGNTNAYNVHVKLDAPLGNDFGNQSSVTCTSNALPVKLNQDFIVLSVPFIPDDVKRCKSLYNKILFVYDIGMMVFITNTLHYLQTVCNYTKIKFSSRVKCIIVLLLIPNETVMVIMIPCLVRNWRT